LHLYTDAISNLETALMQVVQQQQEQEEYPKEAMTEEEIQTECSDRPRGVAHTIYNKKVIHHTHAHTHTHASKQSSKKNGVSQSAQYIHANKRRKWDVGEDAKQITQSKTMKC